MIIGWYALVAENVVGPFEADDVWYHEHAGPDWRARELLSTGVDPWRVNRTDFEDGRSVSTVFLGLDVGWRNEATPLVFETMVFPDCDRTMRYSTWAEALAGHLAVVEEVAHALPPGGNQT